jgi:hypothetical protein
LLVQCHRYGSKVPPGPNPGIIRSILRGPFIRGRSDALLIDCEPIGVGPDEEVRSLLLRSLFPTDVLERAVHQGEPVPVVAFWRKSGLPWTPLAVAAAEHLGVGMGGSMSAVLVPNEGDPPAREYGEAV